MLQVTDAVDSFVQVRILVSAQDGPTIFDLRCHVREAMVRWLVSSNPAGLPRLRVAGLSGASAAAEEALPRAARVEPVPEPSGHDPRKAPVQPRRVNGEATAATTVLPPVAPSAPSAPERRDDSLFTGSMDALERSRAFAGPSEAEQADRVERMLRDEQERVESELRAVAERERREQDDVATRTSVFPAVPERR